MSRAVFIVLLVIGVLFGTTTARRQQHQCPENQEWTTCGSACPRSCNANSHQVCTAQCVVGCRCKPNFVLNSAGKCVLPQNC